MHPRLNLDEVVGQKALLSRLRAFDELYRNRGKVPGHILLVGPPGAGKRTISCAFANSRGSLLQAVDGSTLNVKGDLTAILTNLVPQQVILITSGDRIRKELVQILQMATRDSKLTILIGAGPSARNHVMDVKPFTMICSAIKKADLPQELLDLTSLILELAPYSREELNELANRISTSHGLAVSPEVASLIASTCAGSPHQIEVLLKHLAAVAKQGHVSYDEAAQVFSVLGYRVPPISGTIPIRHDAASLSDMTGLQFEHLITLLLQKMGFRAEMTKTTGDGGIDIVALLERPIVGGRYLFQCKRYALDNLVGVSMVRDFYGAVTADRAVKGVLITTSDFTIQAREFAERVGVELIGQQQLMNVLKENGLSE